MHVHENANMIRHSMAVYRHAIITLGYGFCGISRWLSDFIGPSRHGISSRIVFTSDEVVARSSGMRSLDCDYFVKLDVRDFSLTGAHSYLVDVCLSDITAGPQKEVVSDVLWFLLLHQYVQSTALPGRLWRIVRGSGMGLPYSSHLSD